MKYLASIGFGLVAAMLSYFGVIELAKANYFLGVFALIGSILSAGFCYVVLDSNGY